MSDDQEKEARFVATLKRELDRSTESMDGMTVIRLRAARLRALEAHSRPRAWLLVGGLAGTGVAAALVAILLMTPAAPPITGLEQFDMLSENDSIELYDNLEFYRWLAARPDAG